MGRGWEDEFRERERERERERVVISENQPHQADIHLLYCP